MSMRTLFIAIFVATAPALAQQTYTRPGTLGQNVTPVQGCSGDPRGCIPVVVTGTLSSAGAADTVGNTAAFNANSVCATVLTAGQSGAGFFIGAGTLAATLTPSVSADATPSSPGCTGGTWTATKFVDASQNTASTIVLTNPNSAVQQWIQTMPGTRCARVCTTAFTSGTASGFVLATVVQAPPPAGAADVTDRAGRLLGKVYGSDGNQLATANTGRLQVDVISGGGSNASVVTDGAAPAGSDTQVGGSVTTAAPTYTTGQVKPFSLQTDGSLRVAVTAGGGSNASVAATGAAVPGSATYGGMNVGGNLTGLTGTANGLKTDGSGVTQPISAASLPLPSGAAQDSTLTGGTAKEIVRGGQKGTTNTNADITHTPSGSNHEVLDVGIYDASGNLKDPTQIRTLTTSDAVTATTNADTTIGGTTAPAKELLVGGKTSDGTPQYQPLPLTNGGAAVKTDASATTQPVSLATTGHGTAAGAVRVELPTDGTGVVGLNAGSAIIGKVGIDQTTPGTTNGVQVNAALPAGSNVIGHVIADTGSTTAVTQATAANLNAQVQGAGASGATKAGNPVQTGGVFNTTQPTVTNGQTVEAQATARGALIVATGTDTFNATVSGTVTTTPPVNASTNIAQVNGVTVQTGAGTAGTGTMRVANATSDGAVLATANSGRLQVDVVTGGGSNGSVSATGSAPPASATYAGASVTTAAPTYTNGQMSGLSLNTAGGLRIDEAQVGGTAIDVNTGNASAGTQRVVLASNQPTIPVTQGGAASIFAGQQPLQPYAVAAALPSQAAKQVCFRNLSTSPDYVWLGSSTSVNSTNGQPFAPGEGDCRNIANANQLFFFTMAGATIGYDGTN